MPPPVLPSNFSIASPDPNYTPSPIHLSGRVLSTQGAPIQGATLGIWHTAPTGKYEQQGDNQPDFHLRGRSKNGHRRESSAYAAAYPITSDGPGGKLVEPWDTRPWRRAQIHAIAEAKEYGSLTTQLFDSECEHLGDDAVFAVERELVVGFCGQGGGSEGEVDAWVWLCHV